MSPDAAGALPTRHRHPDAAGAPEPVSFGSASWARAAGPLASLSTGGTYGSPREPPLALSLHLRSSSGGAKSPPPRRSAVALKGDVRSADHWYEGLSWSGTDGNH